jgi:hypothetical protein
MKTTNQRQLALVPEILADQGTGRYIVKVDDEAKQRIWNALGGDQGRDTNREVSGGIIPAQDQCAAAGDAGRRVDLRNEAKEILVSALTSHNDAVARFAHHVIVYLAGDRH